MAFGNRQLVPLVVDFSEVNLEGLTRLEVLVTTFLPTQVAGTSRGVLELEVVLLVLVSVESIDILEGQRAHLTAILVLGLALLADIHSIYGA